MRLSGGRGIGAAEVDTAASVIRLAQEAGLKVATAESLTGGLVAGALTAIPHASEVFVGGVVVYETDLKATLLGVDIELLETEGPVSECVAMAMAEGIRSLLKADVTVATTGAAGPDPHGGKEPGVVCIAAVGPSGRVSRTRNLSGDREDVRQSAVKEALMALVTILQPDAPGGTTVE